MKRTAMAFGILVSTFMLHGCDDTFNPNAPYKQTMIVYAVMSTESDAQFVRVYTTYPVTTNPLSITTDTEVPDAQVTITQDSTTFHFRDTMLVRSDTSRYHSTIKAHVAYGMHLVSGRQYTLFVASPTLGTAKATAIALQRGGLIAYRDASSNYQAIITPGSNARSYIVRMYLDYEVRVDSAWVAHKAEVPRFVDDATGAFVYPKLLTRGIGGVDFTGRAFEAIRAQLVRQFPPGTLRLKVPVFVLTQLDDALYSYYSTANGFPDSGTLRLDEPDYTNITGGFGVFAMSSTTVAIADTTRNPVAPH